MKHMILCGVAIAVCFGLATTASAQYGSNYQYSSYGYRTQEDAQRPVTQQPRDIAVPARSPSDRPYVEAAPQNTTPANPPGPAYGAGSVLENGYGTHYSDYGCDASGNTAPCDTTLGQNLVRSNDRNIVFGLRGLVFERDYEDDRGLGSNWLSQYFFTTDADHDFFAGYEATLGVRNCSGRGWEINYWGLTPDRADVTFAGPPLVTALTGLSSVNQNGFLVSTIFNTADNWRLYRRSELHNVEFNLLRNAGTTCGFLGGTTNIEWIAGFRWLKFSEDFRLASNNSNPGYPTSTFMDLTSENNLAGFQLGGRAERCLNKCWTVSLGTKFGVYNNDAHTCHFIRDNNGTYATVPSGSVDYRFEGRKDDIATIGELDLRLNYQFSSCWRANFGYRAFGIAGVALAADQIPYNFDDTQEIQRVKTNGELLLHGAYFGLEKCF